MARIRSSLSYANVIATIAPLGGGAYAAITLPKNGVGAKQLKKNAVVSKKVKNHPLLKKDFKAGQLPQGPRGLQGLQGLQGPKGDQGAAGTVPGLVTTNGVAKLSVGDSRTQAATSS